MKRKIYFLICFLLVLLFSYTGLQKWMHMQKTLYNMRNQLFSRPVADTLAYGLPFVEMGVAILLIFVSTRKLGLYLSFLLLFLFTSYVAAILLGVFHRVPILPFVVLFMCSNNFHLNTRLSFISTFGHYFQY
jgi:putative oxidoreductase